MGPSPVKLRYRLGPRRIAYIKIQEPSANSHIFTHRRSSSSTCYIQLRRSKVVRMTSALNNSFWDIIHEDPAITDGWVKYDDIINPSYVVQTDSDSSSISRILRGIPHDLLPEIAPYLSSFAGSVVPLICSHSGHALRRIVIEFSLVTRRTYNEAEAIFRAVRESEREMSIIRRRNVMVPASELAIKATLQDLVMLDRDSDQECVICMEGFPAGSEVSGLPCGHVYHRNCISQWLKTSHFCPMCRHSLPC